MTLVPFLTDLYEGNPRVRWLRPTATPSQCLPALSHERMPSADDKENESARAERARRRHTQVNGKHEIEKNKRKVLGEIERYIPMFKLLIDFSHTVL